MGVKDFAIPAPLVVLCVDAPPDRLGVRKRKLMSVTEHDTKLITIKCHTLPGVGATFAVSKKRLYPATWYPAVAISA